MADRIEYVRTDVADFAVPTENARTRKQELLPLELLWGDRVEVIDKGRTADEWEVTARGRRGFVAKQALGGDPLLEVYFIDVGQGDGVLICTPDRRHLLIDGGWPRRGQPSGKNAADFVDWKFHADYGKKRIELDAVLCSHNDQDHYGGLWDLLNTDPVVRAELRCTDVRVEQFFHAGLSWWTLGGKRSLGRTADTDQGRFYTDLIGSRASILAALKPGADPSLQGEWRTFLEAATRSRNRAGNHTPITRLSHAAEYVPGFEKGKDVAVRVLAPVEFSVDGKPAVRHYSGAAGKSTNGNSLLLRLDYGRARILLTGDLNTQSMRSLLDDWAGQRQELQCDVAKACHHGSDDVSYEFLAAMRPAVTVISSGDNEGHDHPRPGVVAASATTGYLQIEKDAIVSPLIYSTELARSVKLGVPTELRVPASPGGAARTLKGLELAGAELELAVTLAGDRNPRPARRRLGGPGGALVVAGIVYGLVNVRTDGETLLCATMNETEHTWQVKKVRSRF